MSGWSVLFVLILTGAVGCRQDAPSPAPEAFPSTTPATTAAEPPATVTDPPKPEPPDRPSAAPVRSFAVYTLSRGKGVPAEAREAQRQIVALAEDGQRRDVKVAITSTRIGLEGETRACLEYEDPQEGARAYERARALVRNVDLINLVVEPCEKAANNKQEKES